MSHDGSNYFTCSICIKRFRTRDNIRKHQATRKHKEEVMLQRLSGKRGNSAAIPIIERIDVATKGIEFKLWNEPTDYYEGIAAGWERVMREEEENLIDFPSEG